LQLLWILSLLVYLICLEKRTSSHTIFSICSNLNDKKYYILESTAKNSAIGSPLHCEFDERDVAIGPFSNTKVNIKTLDYKI